MDIYSFLNSPDIADHCRNIGHVFNSLEMAIIIAISKKTTKEKHSAWREITADYSDMPIPDSNCFKAQDSLHDYLREFISWEEKVISDFFTPDDDVVYRPRVWWDNHYRSDDGCFRTAEKALEAAGESYGWDCWEKYKITEFIIDRETIDAGESWNAHFNSDGEMVNLYASHDNCPGELGQIFFHLPVPFKKGDVLEAFGKVFVLDSLPHWNDRGGG